MFIAVSAVLAGLRAETAAGGAEAQPAANRARGARRRPAEQRSEPAKVALVFRVMREGGGGIDATINQVMPEGRGELLRHGA